jgi:hypothetical protein
VYAEGDLRFLVKKSPKVLKISPKIYVAKQNIAQNLRSQTHLLSKLMQFKNVAKMWPSCLVVEKCPNEKVANWLKVCQI